ncbi:hypothetical protein C8Q76DRAFT_799505 [Earliella scabrosa]|nr:hypothetical protein C8Q76DRAFT_799505 [Earliella scabrosa]
MSQSPGFPPAPSQGYTFTFTPQPPPSRNPFVPPQHLSTHHAPTTSSPADIQPMNTAFSTQTPPRSNTLPPFSGNPSFPTSYSPPRSPFTELPSGDPQSESTLQTAPGPLSQTHTTPTPPRTESNIEITDVVSPLFVDHVAKDFGLNGEHVKKLRAMVHLGSVTPALSQADLATRTYIFAAVISTLHEIKQVLVSGRTGSIDDLPALMHDIKIRLEDTFKLTTEQKENVRAVVQDLIYTATRIKYKPPKFPQEVEDSLKTKQVVLRLNNIFGSPHREKALLGAIRKISSSVRNALRQDIKNSVFDSPISLTEFNNQTAAKYKLGGLGDKPLDRSFIVRNAILRRFALENPHLLNIAEAESENDNAGEETTVDPQAGPPNKVRKTKTTAGGRVPQGEDFWSKFDEYLSGFIKQWGNVITAAPWKSFVDHILQLDYQNFPERSALAYYVAPPTEPISTPSRGGTHPPSSRSSTSPHALANLLNAA